MQAKQIIISRLQTVQHILQCRHCCGTAVSCGSHSSTHTGDHPHGLPQISVSLLWLSESQDQHINCSAGRRVT